MTTATTGLPLLSASGMQLAFTCVGSSLLPQSRENSWAAELGTIKHRFLASVLQFGVEAALAQAPEDLREELSLIELDGLPLTRGLYSPEVAFAWDVATGQGRELGIDIDRAYEKADPPLAPTEQAGTADVFGIDEDGTSGTIVDWKSGFLDAPEPGENRQLKFLALAAARKFKLTRMLIAIGKVKPNGRVIFSAVMLDQFDLDLIAEEQRALHARRKSAANVAASGLPMPTVKGIHCRYCNARDYCPAIGTMIRAFASEPELNFRDLRPTSPEAAAKAWEASKLIRERLKQLDSALYAYAAEQPINLPNGNILGLTESSREKPLADVARRLLEKGFGEEAAKTAIAPKHTTKKLIDVALKAYAVAHKKTFSRLQRDFYDELRNAGGMDLKVSSGVKERRPDGTAVYAEGDEEEDEDSKGRTSGH